MKALQLHAIQSGSVEIPMQPASYDIWDKKYRLKTKSGEILDPDIRATYARIARALADVEATPAKRGEWYEKFLWALEGGAIPAGRVTSNAGAQAHKPATSTINCTVSRAIPDSMDGILASVHEAGLTLKAGCGIGYEFSTLRPKGAFVSGAGAYTSGPLSFMDIFDAMCFTVSSAGGRRGAQMGTFDIAHPDAMDFIRAKREDGRLRQFNLSCLITDEFIDAVKKDAPWDLVFPATQYEYEDPSNRIVWRYWPATAGYISNELGQVACRIYKTIPARRLWDLIMASTYDYAEPGFILIDRINEMNNNWFCENIRATNPCVTADTWIHTVEGPCQVRELIGRPFMARVNGEDHASTEAGFFRTATKPVVRIETAEGFQLRLTADHRVRRVVRFTRYTTETEWSPAGELRSGDRILLNDHRRNSQWKGQGSHEEGYLLGLLIGDGTLKHDAAVLSVWQTAAVGNGPDAALAHGVRAVMQEAMRAARTLSHRSDFTGWTEVAGRAEYRLKSAALRDFAFSVGMRPGDKRITPMLERRSSDFYRGFLRGFFDTDGSVQGTQAKGVSIRLSQSDLPRLEAVQRMLLRLGVVSHIHRNRRAAGHSELPDGKGRKAFYPTIPQHELLISGENLLRFRDLVGFTDTDKAARLKGALNAYQRMLNRERFSARVVAVTPDRTEDVYDTQIPGINTFDANGLHAHNCGEQPLPPYGSCWTGDMRLNTNFGLIRTDDAYALAQQGQTLKIAVDDVFSRNKTDLRPCTLVCNGEKEVFEVRLDNSQHIKVTADHRLYTPHGWREVGELKRGDAVHIQTKELAQLDLVPPFYLGILKYMFSQYDGDEIVITRRNRRAFLRPILDQLRINYTDRAKGLFVSRHHLAAHEVERLDLARAPQEALEGYAYAAQATAAYYKGSPAIYGEREHCERLAWILQRLTGREFSCTHHKKDTYRLRLPALAIHAPALGRPAIDLDYAVYGWLLADGWLTSSAGMLFNDQDDVAMQLLAPRFQVMTGTDGALRKTYRGQRRDVYTLACYRKETVAGLRKFLGLDDYGSKNIRVPEKVFRADTAQQASFLAAVFCADGTVHSQKPLVRMTSASKAWLEDIQLLLLNFGVHGAIYASVSKGNAFYNLNLNQQDAYRYYRYIGFPFSSHKQHKLERLLSEKDRWHTPPSNQIAHVTEIRPIGKQRVYDIEEFSTHTLIVNGVVVHNCLLGSVNLTKFVDDPFTDAARFNWERYREVVAIFTRMLDNVVEINGLPLAPQRHEIAYKRRHGMGFLGLGSTLALLRMKYGASDSVAFTERVAREMAEVGWEVGIELAAEKGPAPIMLDEFNVTEEMLTRRPEMRRDGHRPGDKVPGRVLLGRYSRYLQQFPSELTERIAQHGCRFTHHTSIAPTGTISLSLANNASNGIEPSFAHKYSRNVLREGKKSKEKVEVYSYELLAYRTLVDPHADPDAKEPEARLPDYFVASDRISPREHVDIQAAAQKWVDSSISKTANVPTDFPFEDFKDIYLYAYEKGLKGCTTFRFNPEAFQGVLVKDQDLEKTIYRFTLANGQVVEAKGNEEIEYDGEKHTAANLYDALKEGYYGRF